MPAAPLGHFCWPELFTPDLAAAKAFYTSLFDWSYVDVPSAAGNYTLARMGDDQVAGAFQAPASMGPPRWNTYVQVASADACAESAKALGGAAVGGPFDVPNVGRMAFLQDPAGAVFAAWQSGQHAGATRFDAPGCLCWTELATPHPEAVRPFYEGLFGWRIEPLSDGRRQSDAIYVGSACIGAIARTRGDENRWLPSFAVLDCATVASKAQAAGGKLLMPSMSIPVVGQFARLADPEGAVFHIFRPL
jgi:predicted enzyme related to lactoylglutathione lyase